MLTRQQKIGNKNDCYFNLHDCSLYTNKAKLRHVDICDCDKVIYLCE